MQPRFTLWIIIFLIVGAILISLPEVPFPVKIPNTPININTIGGNFPVKLGLDLQGGTQLVLETDMSKIDSANRDQALASATEVIERRVNLFGVSESIVQSSKLGESRRILVEMPGVTDASAAANLVGKTALLEFRELPASPSAEATMSGQIEFVPTGLTGADLQSAQVVFNSADISSAGSPQVGIKFNDEGAKKFAEITKRNLNKPLAMYLDGQLISNPPIVQQEIIGGEAVISGQFTAEDSKLLATQLNAGALPVPIKIVDQRLIGATLGQESVNKSVLAGVIGLITVMIFMIAYYGFLGVIADIALIIYALLVIAIFRTGFFVLPPITLTLAGIAGFILSIGMAVDANILIFERMKEEKRWGKSNRQALELGFARAWSSIRDSNISSLITAMILYYVGTGLVKGFAITLAIGVFVSMFTAIVITRTILRLLIK